MAQVRNLDHNEEVSEGTFTWELDEFLEKTKWSMLSHSFKFGRSLGQLMLGPALILDQEHITRRVMTLKMYNKSGGVSVFSKETLYNICLIDTEGQEFQSAKGILSYNANSAIVPINLFQDELRRKFQSEDRATIRFSWCAWTDSSVREEGTPTTQDILSEHPRSTLLEKLSDDLGSLYDSKSSTDCVLKVDNVQFPVHRALLSARSTVFAAMFKHETSEKLGGVVDIPDVDVAVLGDVLKYMYSGQVVGLTPETATPMYELADKYAIVELRDQCLCFLKNNITTENVCYAAVLAHTHGEAELEEQVSKFIEDRFENIQQTDRWKQFVNANPSLAVKYLTSSFIACKRRKKDDPN